MDTSTDEHETAYFQLAMKINNAIAIFVQNN
jgi:hypothetical protein